MKIAVLKGGPSAEREVSLRSGAAVGKALREAGHEVEEIDVHGPDFLVPEKTEVVFLALHGTFGEDGQIQAILEKRGLPYTGSGIESSRLAFDKTATKKKFEASGVPTPPCRIMKKGDREVPRLKEPFPWVVKPSKQGSSVGVTIVQKEEDLEKAVKLGFESDDEVLIEAFIDGREMTIAVLGEEALKIVEIKPKSGWYDYQNKYTKGATEYLVPAPLTKHQELCLQTLAVQAHKCLGCRDVSRVDVRMDPNENNFVLEVNTLPGMTETSLLPKAAAAAGISFSQLCDSLAKMAAKRGARS
nr:D-alanine--D-alanine ligase [uncultured bacterium]